LTQANYLQSNLTQHLTMKEILAKTAIYTSNTGQYKDPIDIFNPLEFVGDPRDKNYLFR
jgi:hypothetical protein